ncbi:MAG: hypothetical protein J6R45_04460 [Clostridia bacterium]|nr:hypothetical protein [Clostridia bacterium]
MLTIKEARKIQKSREVKAIGLFLASLVVTLLITFVLMEYTTIFEINSVFYLIPVSILALAVKKTEIYRFATTKEFVGKVVYLNVYVTRDQRIKGRITYTTVDSLEVEMIIENDEGKSKSLQIPSSPATYNIAEGTRLALLRFVDTPIILEQK